MNAPADVFLICLLLGGLACLFWRELLLLLAVLGIATACLAMFYVSLGIQSIAQAT